MSKFFVNQFQINNNRITIIGEDVNHIVNVLRLKENDKIEICNSDTSENYNTKIISINNENVICEIYEKINKTSESNIYINIFQGLPKADKMELIIQKCVELGVKEITPVKMERCIVKLDSKSESKKIERWQKISEVASKQSGRDFITKINNIKNIKDICNLISKYDILLVAYECEEQNSLKQEIHKLKKLNRVDLKIGIVIGPEGGINKEEIEKMEQAGAKTITLGNRILRTETVAFVMASILQYELGDLGGITKEWKIMF